MTCIMGKIELKRDLYNVQNRGLKKKVRLKVVLAYLAQNEVKNEFTFGYNRQKQVL